MANKVTPEDIKKMNILYLDLHSYAAVARETGFSASTIKKYINPNFKIIKEEEIRRFNPKTELPTSEEIYLNLFRGIDNYGSLCVLSQEEYVEILELRKEIEV